MGILDRVRGIRRPSSGMTPLPPAQVREALQAVNDPASWYRVRAGGAPGVAFVVELKLDDPDWAEFFAEQTMHAVFRMSLGLRPDCHEVRVMQRMYLLTRVDGAARYGKVQTATRTNPDGYTKSSVEQHVSTTWTRQDGQLVRDFGGDSSEARDKLSAAATGCGWTWRRKSQI